MDYKINGKVVVVTTKQDIPDLRIEAWGNNQNTDIKVSKSVTNTDGQFEISFSDQHYSGLFGDLKPKLFFKVFQDEVLIYSTKNRVYWDIDEKDKEIVIEILSPISAQRVKPDIQNTIANQNSTPETQAKNTVFGIIKDSTDMPLPNVVVEVFDVHLRSWQLLADSLTDKHGKYKIIWQKKPLDKKGKDSVDIGIKIKSKLNKTELFRSSFNEIRYNASSREEINITITQKVPSELIEFDYIQSEVKRCIGDISITDLQENTEHHDISYLSKTLQISKKKIEDLVLAEKLFDQSLVEPAFFYALMQKNTYFKSNTENIFSNRISIGIDTNIKLLLFDTALLDRSLIEEDIKLAIEGKLISREMINQLSKYLDILATYQKEAESYYQNEHPQKVMDSLVTFLQDDRLLELQKQFKENKADLDSFLENSNDTASFKSETDAAEAKTKLALGKLFGYGNEIIPIIAKSKGIYSASDIKKLARLNKKEWEVEIKKANGSIKDENLISNYASMIVRKLEKEFPTLAYTAQLERETKPVLKNQEKIVSFFKKHDDFDFLKHNVEIYFKENKIPKTESNEIVKELKSIQSVLKLIPNYSKVNALRQNKINSAQSIVKIGKARFLAEIAPKVGLEPNEAKLVYQKAEYKNVAALLIAGELIDSASTINISSFETSTLSTKIDTISKDFPNLKSLFKLTDSCECKHCRSIVSPAAYLVEILQFLDQRKFVNTSGSQPSAKEVLFNRRPDLGEIGLNCSNSNTPLKYIDLVCEILEEAIAPDQGKDFTGGLLEDPTKFTGKISNELYLKLVEQGFPVTENAQIYITELEDGNPDSYPVYLHDTNLMCKIVKTIGNSFKIHRLRQTFGSAEELAAAPEYVNQDAYSVLKNSQYAFKLPFDLNHIEASSYFKRFNVSRSDLMKAFQVSNNQTNTFQPTNEEIAAEILGLSDTERKIIITPKATIAGQQLFWNAPDQWSAPTGDNPATDSGNVVDYMKRVDHFLDKTGLSFKELNVLLDMKFIDPDKELFIKHLDLTCNTEKKEIANLDDIALDKMHRLLRLKKTTHWSFQVLDEMISQPALGNGNLDDGCLIKMAQLQKVSEKTGIVVDELVGFFGEIPYKKLQNENVLPLYYKLFLNKAKNGYIDKKLSSPTEKIGSEPLSEVLTYLSVCFQTSEKELKQIMTGLNLTSFGSSYFKLPESVNSDPTNMNKIIPGGNLPISNPNKSCNVVFDKENPNKFKNLSLLFLITRLMKKLKLKAGEFLILKDLTKIDFFESPEKLLEFIQVFDDISKSSLKLSEIYFMLNHATLDPLELPDYEMNDEKITSILTNLQIELQENFVLNKPIIQENPDIINGDELNIEISSMLKVINKKDMNLIKKFFLENPKSLSLNILTNEDTLENEINELSIDDVVKRLKKDPGEKEKKCLSKKLLDYSANYQIFLGKKAILEKTLSSVFKTETVFVETILKYITLKQSSGTDFVFDLLTSDALIDTDNPEPALPVVSYSNFPEQYSSLRLLHKLIPFIQSFKLKIHEIEGYFQNNANLDWFLWDEIPYQTGQTPIPLTRFISFLKIVDFTHLYPPVTNAADIDNPISLFSICEKIIQANNIFSDDNPLSSEEFFKWLSILTYIDVEILKDLDTFLFSTFDITHYQSIENWYRIIVCSEFIRKLNSDVNQIAKYIKPILTGEETKTLRASLKSRYSEDTWLITLKEIMDVIRPQKRDALVAYLLATNPGIKDENDLFEYFLIDVEMESCMPSSRIVQAHSSVQLFVQRCLMGLEPSAVADTDQDPNWNQWEWMKNYRVWEASRQIFLYPENWYDISLTDDKSYLLSECISELQQNELTMETATNAFINYLEKLDNIAFLEVMATWYQTTTRTMHVFARTKGGDPAIYYYRRFVKERYWTPWEKVELDITGNHLLAFMRNNRLYLAWLLFSEQPEPNPEVIIPSASGGNHTIDKPKKQLKIQLAISEYSNKKWQPKKISNDSIFTPSTCQIQNNENNDLFQKENYHLLYFHTYNQIYITFLSDTQGSFDICGVFNLTGCKGYPEVSLLQVSNCANFKTIFSNTTLLNQRYNETYNTNTNALEIINNFTYQQNKILLKQTPGTFRITFPHQETVLDNMNSIFQDFPNTLYTTFSNYTNSQRDRYIGSLLPYFLEDSNHAYVIIPGFYKQEIPIENIEEINHDVSQLSQLRVSSIFRPFLTDSEKRTASDVIQLIEDGLTWLIKNKNKTMSEWFVDPDFQELLNEMSKYEALDVVFDIFITYLPKQSNNHEELKEQIELLTSIKNRKGLVYGEQFKNLYHPLVCQLKSILYADGMPGLMQRNTQMSMTTFKFSTYYMPDNKIVPMATIKKPTGSIAYSFPLEDLDFTSDGSYSVYNWDLFFRLPLYIANNLTKNQRFEEALKWYHYMFNPTGALPGSGVQKYWVTKPFYMNQSEDYISQRIDSVLFDTADPQNPHIKELEFAVGEWRKKPFSPDVVARFRPVAYQKALLMNYINNLIQWGDYLFRQDTMESIAQATQMYILADKLLGPKPRIVPAIIQPPVETYNQIEAKLDSFGNALVEIENLLPDPSVLPEEGQELPFPMVTLSMLYFCIPINNKMMETWNVVADRLFKIRHCQNFDGVERNLSLFAPPIDPGLLARAAATGLDISSIVAGLSAETPYYRFNILSQKATELSQEVRGLGNSLLQALEKKDAEKLALIRSELEIKVLKAVRDMKVLQINESKEQIENIKRTKCVIEEREQFYEQIEYMNDLEKASLVLNGVSTIAYTVGSIMELAAGATSLIPDVTLGASGFGGSPVITSEVVGGKKISSSISSFAKALILGSQVVDKIAGGISTIANYERRNDEWQFQKRIASKELIAIEKQITAAEIRKEIAETDLRNHDLQIENAKTTDEFMHSKYTNLELYDWMIGQISSVYFKSYQLAYELAKKAERCYQFELGNDNTFISYGYWDSLKKGLQSADNLMFDIKRMESNYLDNNKREYELTKHISLAMLDPIALLKLRATGSCYIDIPEVLFDMDHPGHFFRRIKSVSISIPCIAGPYTSVSAKLSQVSNKYRTNTDESSGYQENSNDDRFKYNIGSNQSIATSNAQNDSGMFELNFRDERYLPFEGTGAISTWQLELPDKIRQFDYNTISDVIIHIKYTAREGGSTLRTAAENALKTQLDLINHELVANGLCVVINLKHDMPNEWHLFKQSDHSVNLRIDKARLPYMAQILNPSIVSVMFIAKSESSPTITINTDLNNPINLSEISGWGNIYQGQNGSIQYSLEVPFSLSCDKDLEELILLVKYSFS